MANEFRKVTDQNGVDHPVTDQKAQDGVIANTKLIKDTVGWSGKNKCPNDLVSYNANNTTITVNADKSVSLTTGNGGATADTWMVVHAFNPNELPAGNYKISGCPSGGSNQKYEILFREDPAVSGGVSREDFGNGATLTISDTSKTYKLFIGLKSGQTANNLTFKPMIHSADILDPTYEPYFGSTAFPRSEQAVLGAKNLLYTDEKTKTYEGITYTINKDSKGNITSISVSGTPTAYSSMAFWADIKPDIYKISHMENAANFIWGEITLYKNGSQVQDLPSLGTADDTVIDLRSYDFDKFKITAKRVSNSVATTATIYPMLRLASDTDSTYQPYAMTNRELTDAVNNKISKTIKEISSTSVDLNDITETGFYIASVIPVNSPENQSYFNMLVLNSLGGGVVRQIVFAASGSNSAIYTRTYSGSTWKNWIKFTGTEITPA